MGQALVCGRRLTLMELAHHWPGAERVRAPLKRLDRLPGNRQVQALRASFYSVTMNWMLGSAQSVLIVDWSELKKKNHAKVHAAFWTSNLIFRISCSNSVRLIGATSRPPMKPDRSRATTPGR